MSKNALQREGQRPQPALHPENYEELMTWRIRWFLVIIITFAYILSLLAGFVGYFITKDAHFLLFITPTALLPLIRYLVPMDQKRYELARAKIEANKELAAARVRIGQLEARPHKQQEQLITK